MYNIFTDKKWFDFINKEISYNVPRINPGKICVDCGCNVGAFTIRYHHLFNKIICIDACKENIKAAEEYFQKFKIPKEKYSLRNLACWDMRGKVKVMTHSYNGDVNYFRNSGNIGCIAQGNSSWGWIENNIIYEVDSITIEDLIDELKEIELMKIDIELSENKFLLNKDLSKIRNIVMELHSSNPEEEPLFKHITKTHLCFSTHPKSTMLTFIRDDS